MIQGFGTETRPLRSELKRSLDGSPPGRAGAGDETLVVDGRSSQRPAQEVEERLIGMLDRLYIPISQIRHRTLTPSRNFPRDE